MSICSLRISRCRMGMPVILPSNCGTANQTCECFLFPATQERKFVAFTGWTRVAFIFSESLSRQSNFLKAFTGY